MTHKIHHISKITDIDAIENRKLIVSAALAIWETMSALNIPFVDTGIPIPFNHIRQVYNGNKLLVWSEREDWLNGFTSNGDLISIADDKALLQVKFSKCNMRSATNHDIRLFVEHIVAIEKAILCHGASEVAKHRLILGKIAEDLTEDVYDHVRMQESYGLDAPSPLARGELKTEAKSGVSAPA